jgi:hypothetical protein
MSEDKMSQNVKEFNKLFGFREEAREGTLSILNDTWSKAKALLNAHND